MLTGTLDILRAIAEEGPDPLAGGARLCGMGAGQLEQELCSNGWFATAGSEELLYGCDVGSRWASAFSSAGIDTRLLNAGFGTA